MLKKYPFYLKATVILFGLALFFFTLYILRPVLVPVSFGLMLAILLNPVVNWLQQKKINRTLAIAIAILIIERIHFEYDIALPGLGQASC